MQSLYVISEELAGQTESALANLAKHSLCVWSEQIIVSCLGFFSFFFFF